VDWGVVPPNLKSKKNKIRNIEFWELFPSNQPIHLGVFQLCFGVQAGFFNFHESITK
jgi:hypothetical protein